MSPFSPSLKKTHSLLLSHSLKSVLLSHYLAFSLDASLLTPSPKFPFARTLTLSLYHQRLFSVTISHYLLTNLPIQPLILSLTLTLTRTHATSWNGRVEIFFISIFIIQRNGVSWSKGLLPFLSELCGNPLIRGNERRSSSNLIQSQNFCCQSNFFPLRSGFFPSAILQKKKLTRIQFLRCF